MRPYKSERQFTSRSKPMTGALAASIGRRMVEIEYRGHGDLDGAMYRLEAKTGISYWTWWAWRNRPPTKDVLRATWERLIAAYQIECSRQKRQFEEELAEAQALGRDETNSILVRTSLAVVRAKDGEA